MNDSSQGPIQKLGEFDTPFAKAYVYCHYSPDGAIAIQLYSKRDYLITTLSINVPGLSAKLGPNEFAVRSWHENEVLIGPALGSGLFEDTGRVGPPVCGHVPPIWRIRSAAPHASASPNAAQPLTARAS